MALLQTVPLGGAVPRGSYPTPFLKRLLFKITDPKHKTRYPKKGLGYEPLGTRARSLTQNQGLGVRKPESARSDLDLGFTFLWIQKPTVLRVLPSN